MMMSQATNHQFDHLNQQQSHIHPTHIRHVSNASSLNSLGSHDSNFHPSQYSQPNSTNYAVPVSYTGNVSADAAFGGVPVSADAFHQYPQQHQRSSSTSSSSSPYTEPTSVSEDDAPEGMAAASTAHGTRKTSQIQMMRRARAQASPYSFRPDQLPWNGCDQTSTTSHLMRSHSIASDAPSSTEEEIAQLLRSHSRESSVSDWNLTPQTSQPSTVQSGLGSAGAFMDPYATVANVHGHGGAFGSTPVSMSNNGANVIGGMMSGGLAGMGGMMNPSMVGGVGAQMRRMTLDSTETYEALAHHIRTAVTTSASDRARQAFVQAWLNSSYISYTDGNVSRQGLYGSYLRICQQYDIKPINSASFGKSVRQSFPNIKTRRLGVRGNSKYHYCGIRPATAKEAEILMNLSKNEKPEPVQGGNTPSSADDEVDSEGSSSRRVSIQNESNPDETYHGLVFADTQQPQTPKTARPSFRQSIALPNLDEVLSQPTADDLDHQKARDFWSMYVEHSQSLIDSVKNYRFDQFELTLRTFWTRLDSSMRECVTHSLMMSLIYRADAVIYDEILDYLHSQTLRQMPQQAFGSLRQLAQNMEQVIIAALEGFSNDFVGPKIELAARFGHLVVRNLGICQLAQALSGIFSNPNNLKEMAEAWDGIDFEAVRNQAALVTNCHHEVLGTCFEDFRAILNNPNASIEHFISFVESTSQRCLQPTADNERGLSPRSLLVRWCFVSSQLIRDLTLRSAASFGSFQIVNLFFDEWLGFMVLRKVALHVAAVAASVDTTPAVQVQTQSIGSENVTYFTENSNNFLSFTADNFDANKLLANESSIPAGEPSTLSNSDFRKDPNPDGFLVSSSASQAYALAQQHPRAQSNALSPINNTSVVSSNSCNTVASDQSGDQSSSSKQRHSDTDSGSQPHASLDCMVTQAGLTGIDDLNDAFDDSAFNEFMDVSGFSMTMGNPKVELHSNPILSQTCNSTIESTAD